MTANDPFADKLVAFAAGELDAQEAGLVIDHLETCKSCSQELDFLADLVSASGEVAEDEQAAPRPAGLLRRFPVWATALAAAAAVLLLIVPRLTSTAPSVAGWADRSLPAYVPVDVRSDEGAAFARAMQPYVEDDFAAAEVALSEYLADQPEDAAQASFFRAMSRVQLDDLAGAAGDLRRAHEQGGGFLRERAGWWLAQVALMREDLGRARTLLSEIAAEDGEFAPNAVELLNELPAE